MRKSSVVVLLTGVLLAGCEAQFQDVPTGPSSEGPSANVAGPGVTADAAPPNPCPVCALVPTTFTRRDGQTKPDVREFLADPSLDYLLVVQDDGQEGTRAEIKLNGETVVARQALYGVTVSELQVVVRLSTENRLTVLPVGRVGSSVTVWILGGERVGPGGGTVQLAGGDIQLDLPAGAVQGDVLITAAPATSLPPGGPPVVPGTAWDFGPDGLVFAQPVVMTLAFDPAKVPAGVDPNELRIHKFVNGTFEQQNAGLVDLVNHTVSAEVDGFSVFVVIPRNPVNPEDLLPPDIRAMEVLDPSTGTFGNAVTLTTSAADANLTFRLTITDNVTGVEFMDVRWLSPTGRQLRFPCFRGGPPDVGNDTNGQWICQSVFPRYAEAGAWRPEFVTVRDKIQNSIFFSNRPQGFCDTTGTQCLTVPQITVVSSPSDVSTPVLQSLGMSLATQPRMFGPSVSIDLSMGARQVFYGFQATDDLAGVSDFNFFDKFSVQFIGPSNQSMFLQGIQCVQTQGTTTLSGFWECSVTFPGQAEAGTWNMTFLRVPDRAGNGGFSGQGSFTSNGMGQLCNQTNCVTAPTVQVTSAGDGAPPVLQTVNIASPSQSDVVTTLGITDNLSGVSFVRVRYNSALTTQFQECFPPLIGGVPTNGTWECTITFSQFAARGQWVLSVQVFDIAGNTRFYSRRASDGFLCYFDPSLGQVCQDFGTTDIVLQ